MDVRLHFLGVDAYCAEKRTVFEFMGCFWHGCKCQPFRDLKSLVGDTPAERYERIEQITKTGYTVKVMWKCEFDVSKIGERKPELLTTNCEPQSTIHTRCPVRGSNRGHTSSLQNRGERRNNPVLRRNVIVSFYL